MFPDDQTCESDERCPNLPERECHRCYSHVCREHFDMENATCVNCAVIDGMHSAVTGNPKI